MAAKSTFPCPACGEDVPAKAKACPHCGACGKTGWSEEANYDGLDLPDDDFDYDKFTQEEFGTPQPSRKKDLFLKITAALLVLVFIFLAITNYLFRQ